MTRWFYLAVLFTLAALAGSCYVYRFQYDQLPEQVPIHWNINGQPDGFIPKSDVFGTFLLMPAIMAGVLVLTLLLPWLSPRHFQVDPFRGVYGYVMMLITALLAFIHGVMLFGSLHPELPIDRVLIGGLCFFFVLIGAVLGKVRRNFWMGVRTPWTLASDEVWDRTHQLSARLFVAAGLLGLLTALVGLPLWLGFAAIFAAALVPVFYSLVLYKLLQRQGRV